MQTEGQSAAQGSLNILEARMLQFEQFEQQEIEGVRTVLREMIARYGSSAELAIIAVGFEIAIKEKQ